MPFSKKVFISIAIICLIIIVLIVSRKKVYLKHDGEIFGTYFNIQYQTNKSLLPEIYSIFEEIENSLSTYDSTSIISKLNKNSSVTLDKHFIKVFQCAEQVYYQTNGAFDITIAPIVDAWGFGSGKKREVTPALIESLLPLVGMENISVKNKTITKKNPAIQLDVSAIAKGYAVDMISELLKKHNIQNFLVEIGGELRIKGKNKHSNPWTVGINKPSDSQGANNQVLFEVLHISYGAIATSGNYRQYYFKDGKKYSHTINPKTGYPVQHRLLSATVWANTCIKADAYATAFMVMGVEKSIALKRKLQDVEMFLIYQDDKEGIQTYISSGFNKFTQK